MDPNTLVPVCTPPNSLSHLIEFQRNSGALRIPERTFGARGKERVAGSAGTKRSKT